MGYLSDLLSPSSVWAQALNRPPSGPQRRMADDDPRQSALAASMNAENESLLDLYSVLLNERGADGERPLGPSALEQMQTLNEMTPYDPDSADMMAGLPDALEYMMDSSLMPGPGVMAGTVGRAGGVADALSGAADDAARVADDLPMDEVSRMGRAREQGRDVDTYHGTGDDFEYVDLDKLGKSQSLLGDALYSSTGTKRPNIYAVGKSDPLGPRGEAQDGGQIMPLTIRSEGMLDLTRQMSPDESSRIAKTFENAGAEVTTREDGSFFVEYEGRSAFVDNYRPMDGNFKLLRDAFGMKNLQEVLEESGFTGVIGAEGNGSKVYANYRPEDVRSRFAKFDPRNINSRDLLASGLGGGALGYGLLGNNDAEASQ